MSDSTLPRSTPAIEAPSESAPLRQEAAQTTETHVATFADLPLGTDDEADDLERLTPEEEAILRAGARLHRSLIEQIDPRERSPDTTWLKDRARLLVGNIAASEGVAATPRIRNSLIDNVINEIVAYGPIQPLLDDPEITEIIVNGCRCVWVERRGVLERTRVAFIDNAHVMRIVQRMLASAGRRVDESSPMVDARLPDGSRLNVVVPPIASTGPAMSIRKHGRIKLSLTDLVERGTLSKSIASFLRTAVDGKLNILISGGTSSGKTSTLNALAAFIHPRERIITIEDSAELRIRHPGLLSLQSRPSNPEGVGEVTIRDLVRNALRMRPDRIIVGEVRGGEALDMLQAMLTGHRGSLSTIHGNSPRDTLERLETMSLMAGVELPLSSIQKQIASAVHVIVQQERFPDGIRRVTHITEVLGSNDDSILLQNIFEFHHTGVNEKGEVRGHHFATGLVPRCFDRLRAEGVPLPDQAIFERGESK